MRCLFVLILRRAFFFLSFFSLAVVNEALFYTGVTTLFRDPGEAYPWCL